MYFVDHTHIYIKSSKMFFNILKNYIKSLCLKISSVRIKSITQKNSVLFLFFIFSHAKIPRCFRTPRCYHQFLTYIFISASHFSNLRYQVKSLIRFIVRVSYSSKIIIKVNNIKNADFITIENKIIRIFNKIEYMLICISSSQMVLNYFT